jgi:glycerol-3-phosphate dehydrogenase (NAD(P)+)
MKIGVIGAGAFGTALAISLARDGREVALWSRDAGHVAEMCAGSQNARRLPGLPLPSGLHPTAELDDLAGSDAVLLALPMQQLGGFLGAYGAALPGVPLVACCKGIDLTTGQGPVAVIETVVPVATAAVLTGPSFARDIASGLPTALTLACADAETGKALQHALSTRTLRLYRTTDTIGAELGGALKNVMAIACGTAIGAGLGDSARAALMTRGFAEMTRMATALGARPETLAGLSGFGDLVLTCTSEGSRNYRFGLALGRGEGFDPAVTVEGAATARAALARARLAGLDMPITASVVALIDRASEVTDILAGLLSRPLKEE